MTASPLDDVKDLILGMPPVDLPAEFNNDGSLKYSKYGRLERLGDWLAACQRQDVPKLEKTTLALFAGSHGLANRGVSEAPEDSTQARIKALQEGKLPTNGIAADAQATVKVFELALEIPTGDITVEPAMSERDCAATIAFGMEAIADKPDCLALGVIGRGGGTAAAALAAALYGGQSKYWVRAGHGSPPEINAAREDTVYEATEFHRGHMANPLEALSRLGGRELAACVGAIIAAGHQGIPVVLDSFATAVAAGVIHSINPNGLAHVVAGQLTDRPSHKAILERIHLDPIMDLQLELGDGYGSVLSVNILRAAAITKQMRAGAN